METKPLASLNKNPRNPRKINKDDFENLKKSIERYGDLSCIVFNVRTQQLVCGHQRMEAFNASPGEKRIDIEKRYDPANRQGTVAEGKLWYDNESYKYREVDWNDADAEAAGIAANRIQGENDIDLLAQVNYELSQLENGAELLAATGQSDRELKRLNKLVGVEDAEQPADDKKPDGPERFEVSLTTEQREVIEEALNYIKANKDLLTEQNASLNGAALYFMAREFLDQLHAEMANNPPIAPAEPSERLDAPV